MFPYPCWLNDKYLFIISRTLPMCMVISWVYIVAMSTKRIVYEKELRLKEVFQKLPGLFMCSYVLSIMSILISLKMSFLITPANSTKTTEYHKKKTRREMLTPTSGYACNGFRRCSTLVGLGYYSLSYFQYN